MKTRIVLIAAMLLMSIPAIADSYEFSVTNNTDTRIKKILVSENGRQYGYFDIGKGIAPGDTVELVWDDSTEGENCVQYFKAVFADGEESEPQKFDFCEEDVAIEFE